MKKILSFAVITAFVLISNKITAQQLAPVQQQAVDKLFKTSSVVYFKFKVNSTQEIPQFAKIFTVDKAQGGQVSAHATKAQFTQFIRMNYPYTVASGGTTAKKAPAGTAKKKTTKTSTTAKKTVKKK